MKRFMDLLAIGTLAGLVSACASTGVPPMESLPAPPAVVKEAKLQDYESLEAWKRNTAHSILVVGDSLSVGIGAGIEKLLKDHPGITVAPRGKVGSGLNSPRFHDWESKLSQYLDSLRPDLVVVLIGGNDAYNGPGTEAWAAEFRPKVERFLEIARERGVAVFWVGLPAMKSPRYSEKVVVANAVMEDCCRKTGDCRYIDTYGQASNYTAMRAGDGIHFTFTGYVQLSQYILDRIAEYFELGDSRPVAAALGPDAAPPSLDAHF